jgi:hypothetical protein
MKHVTKTAKTLALLLPLAFATPVFAQNVTITNGNGGTVEKNRDCVRENGQVVCGTSTTATTANGQTVSKDRQRTTTSEGTTSTMTCVGPTGEPGPCSRTVQITR